MKYSTQTAMHRANGLITDPYVGFLVNDEFGDEVVKMADSFLPDMWRVRPENPQAYERYNCTLERGHVFGYAKSPQLAAINTALDKLGVRNVRTALAEDVLSVLRTPNHPVYGAWGPFGIAIPNMERVKPMGDDLANAELLAQQTGIKDCPVYIQGPRLVQDDRFPSGMKFIYTEQSVATPAPELDGEEWFYYTTEAQNIERLLKVGRSRAGNLRVEIRMDSRGLSGVGEAMFGHYAAHSSRSGKDEGILTFHFDSLYWVRGMGHHIVLAKDES